MPKFLLKVSYTADGAKGVIKDGGTGRRAAVEKMVQGAGGKLESFYYALGEDDAYVIADVPDAITATAISMTVAASGGVRLKTVPLLTCEQIDEAARKAITYRAPGK